MSKGEQSYWHLHQVLLKHAGLSMLDLLHASHTHGYRSLI